MIRDIERQLQQMADSKIAEHSNRLADSPVLWERRIAIIATWHYIKRQQFGDTLQISNILLHDREDLIHKAVGWMLREIGNQDRNAGESFLRGHYQ